MSEWKKFRALGNRQRHAIIVALLDYGSMEIEELEKHVPHSTRAASNYNIRILRSAGFIKATRYPTNRMLYQLIEPELIGHIMDEMGKV